MANAALASARLDPCWIYYPHLIARWIDFFASMQRRISSTSLQIAICFVAVAASIGRADEPIPPDLQISGVYPHLTTYGIYSQNGGHFKEGHNECGIGAVVPWAGKLWMVNYAPHMPHGSEHKLYSIDEDFKLTIHPESVGGTNWDAALRQIPSAQYDIALFVTDGNPTAYGTPGTGGNSDYGSAFDSIDLTRAVTAADALKTSGTFVMGLGVGSDLNISNIKAISGDVSGTDYFKIDNYDKLTAKLSEIALKNCQGTVSIVKQVRDLDGTLVPAAGWTFNGREADNVSPSSAVTGSNGAVNFKVNNLQAAGRTVQFAELQQAGHALEKQNGVNAKCTNNSTGKAISAVNAGDLGFSVSVKRADAISCTVINAKIPVQVKVTKTWVNAVDGDKASFTANAKTGTSAAPAKGDVLTASFAQGTTVVVEEILASSNKGVYTTALQCTDTTGTTVTEGTLTGSFVLGANSVTCAYTNTNTVATVAVEKKWIVDGISYNNGDQPDGISAALSLTEPVAGGALAQKWAETRRDYQLLRQRSSPSGLKDNCC